MRILVNICTDVKRQSPSLFDEVAPTTTRTTTRRNKVMQRNRAMFRIIWTYCALKPRNVGRRHAVNWYFGGRETKCSPFLLVLNCLTKFTILDQELIPYRYPSCSCCSCWGDPLQENLYSVVSNRIGITFGRIVLQANMHPLTESDFLYEIRILRWRPRRHFTQKSAATR